jgi:3-methyladenine DNA glycosylase Tag
MGIFRALRNGRIRGKIEATITNARATLRAQERHGSLAAVV